VDGKAAEKEVLELTSQADRKKGPRYQKTAARRKSSRLVPLFRGGGNREKKKETKSLKPGQVKGTAEVVEETPTEEIGGMAHQITNRW